MTHPNDGRGFVDLVTGRAVLRCFRLEEQIGYLLTGSLPLNNLPEILHERAHHDLVSAPVGIALAALSQRLSYRYLRGEHGIEMQQDYQRWFLVRTFLRPLAEGLALFAEHDVFPGDSRIASSVSTLVFPLFCRGTLRSAPDRAEFERRRKAAIAQARSALFAVSAKADLLEAPLDVNGYFAGYWLVKHLHRQACRLNNTMYDSDFFYSYALTWFFGDAELAEALISPPEARGGASLQAVSLLFQLRFCELLDEGLSSRAAEHEAFLASRPLSLDDDGDVRESPAGEQWPTFCGWSAARKECFGLAIARVIGEPRGLLFQMWNSRSIFRLGHFDADVSVENGEFQASIEGQSVLSGAALDVEQGLGGGCVEAFVDRNGLSCIITIRRGETLVAAIDVHRRSINDVRALMLAHRVPPIYHSEILQIMFGLITELEPTSVAAPEFLAEVQQIARFLFLMPVLMQEDPQRAVAIIERLHDGGILQALHGNRVLLRTLAAVSLQNSLGQFTVERLAENLELPAFDLRERLEKINAHTLETLEIELVGGLPDLALSYV